MFYDVYNKIKIFRELQTKYNIMIHNDLNFSNSEAVQMSDDSWDHIKKLFRFSKPKPENTRDLKVIFIQMIKNITEKEIITAKRSTVNKSKIKTYEFNMEYITPHLELNSYSNASRVNYDSKFNNLLGITAYVYTPIRNDDIGNLDDGLDFID